MGLGLREGDSRNNVLYCMRRGGGGVRVSLEARSFVRGGDVGGMVRTRWVVAWRGDAGEDGRKEEGDMSGVDLFELGAAEEMGGAHYSQCDTFEHARHLSSSNRYDREHARSVNET